MKFSIIVPVWNTEAYLEKCLNSVKMQSYNNYEVIVIDDGSTDNSVNVIDNFCQLDNRFTLYKKENSGVSDTRNFGITKVTGDYILFLDSDDYYNPKLLEEINDKCQNSDIVKFGCQLLDEDNSVIKTYNQTSFNDLNELESIKILTTDDLLDSPCIYAFKTSFYQNNHFLFEKNKRHEDFGLIPFIILKASSIITIDYIGYNYIKQKDSFMNTNTDEMIKKKFNDFFDLYKILVTKVKETDENTDKKDLILIYITDSVIRKYASLNKKMKKQFKTEWKNAKIYNNIPTNTTKRFIKKIALQINYKFYLILTNIKRK